MTQKQMAERIAKLEEEIALLRSAMEQNQLVPKKDWWRAAAGEFRDDPDFPEVIRLGRKYRKSLDRKAPVKKKTKVSR